MRRDAGVKGWLDALRRLFDARSEPRQPLAEHAILTIAGRDHAVRLFDISKSGAMVGYEGPAEAGESVLIHVLDREPLRGQVRWSRDGRIGVGFEAPNNHDEDPGQ